MVEIRCKYANEAREGKKYGSIFGADGERYVCPAAMVEQFHPGQRYDVEIHEDVWGGKEVRIIAKMLPCGADGATDGGAVTAGPPDVEADANRMLLLQMLGSEDGREVVAAARQLLFGLAVAGGNLRHDLERKRTVLDAG
jgi:hypothetical protein